jgi:two-component system LytT family sensor kinase
MEISARVDSRTVYPRLFALYSDSWLIRLAIWPAPPWSSAFRSKSGTPSASSKLEEQKRLLLEARLDALQRQINPHFLFNTLNSIASLVRFRPSRRARLIVKLANILRKMLN